MSSSSNENSRQLHTVTTSHTIVIKVDQQGDKDHRDGSSQASFAAKLSPSLHKCYSFPRYLAQPPEQELLEVPSTRIAGDSIREDYGSTSSLNTGMHSSTISLDVHAPSLPVNDCHPFGLSASKRSESCPCIIKHSTAFDKNRRTIMDVPLPLSCQFSSASARASPSPDSRHQLKFPGSALSDKATTSEQHEMQLTDEPRTNSSENISTTSLQRRANWRNRRSARKCEEWLNRLSPEEDTIPFGTVPNT